MPSKLIPRREPSSLVTASKKLYFLSVQQHAGVLHAYPVDWLTSNVHNHHMVQTTKVTKAKAQQKRSRLVVEVSEELKRKLQIAAINAGTTLSGHVTGILQKAA